MIYRQDEKLTELGEAVRGKFHSERLDGLTILYLFQDEPPKVDGREVVTATTKPQALASYFCKEAFDLEPDFLIRVDEMEFQNGSKAYQKAVLDHALAFCDVSKNSEGDAIPKIRRADIVEFLEVVKRQGAYNPKLREFVAECQQLKLFPQDAA